VAAGASVCAGAAGAGAWVAAGAQLAITRARAIKMVIKTDLRIFSLLKN
jgi:hypothetical protein